MRLPGWILLKIILFQVLPVFQIGINYFDGEIFLLFGSFCFFSFLFAFFSPVFPQVVPSPLGHFAPASRPSGREGWLSCGECTRFLCGALPAEQSPVLGTVDPRANFARGKTSLPERARNHARVEQVVLFQDDRKHHQGFPAVLFPFSREDVHRFPLRVQAVFPYRRKTPRPMGS